MSSVDSGRYRYRPVLFFVLTYLFTWGFWIPAAFVISEFFFASFRLPKRSAKAAGTPHRQARAILQLYMSIQAAMIAVEI